MTNFKEWIQRALTFAGSCWQLPGETEVEIRALPPLPSEDAKSLASQLRHGLPDPLKRLFMEGSKCFSCSFSLDNYRGRCDVVYSSFGVVSLFGGPKFCPADSLIHLQEEVEGWADGFDLPLHQGQCVADSQLWHRCVPFQAMRNGDYLALDTVTLNGQLPVVYLNHDGAGESRIISPSLDAFLDVWEEICYVGPEIWYLAPFFDVGTKMLTSQAPAASAIRKVFSHVKRSAMNFQVGREEET
jgi:hypothetical protein